MLNVATLMQTKPTTVSPSMALADFERLCLSSGFSGFPVVEGDRLIGVVTRSDVVRSMLAERSRAEQVSDFYVDVAPESAGDVDRTLESIAAQVGVRLAALHVSDVMTHNVVSIESSESVRRLARFLIESRLHRLPVVDGERLVGVVTSTDIVRAVAEGLLVEGEASAASRALTG